MARLAVSQNPSPPRLRLGDAGLWDAGYLPGGTPPRTPRVGSTVRKAHRCTCVPILLAAFGAVAFGNLAPLHAQERPPVDGSVDAGRAYDLARSAFDARDYELALDWLHYAHRKRPRAAYVFAMGRAQEAMGRLAEAHGSYLLCRTQPGATRQVEEQAAAEAGRLEPLVGKAVLRLAPPDADERYQLDGRVVPEPDQDAVLEAGSHQLCRLGLGGRRLFCWRRPLLAGFRAVWPPPPDAALRGTVEMAEEPRPALLSVDGERLFLDVRAVDVIELDVGERAVEVRTAEGPSTVTVRVLPGSAVRIPAEPHRAREPYQTIPYQTAVEPGPAPAPAPGPSRVGPWVMLGVSMAACVAGGLTLAGSAAKAADLESRAAVVDDRGVIQGIYEAEAQKAQDHINVLTATGATLVAVGGLAAAGATLWLLLFRSEDQAATPRVWVGPGAGSLFVGSRF